MSLSSIVRHNAITLGMGMTSFNQHTSTWGSAIFAEGIGTAVLMFTILGIVDSRSPGDLAGIVIGGVVIAIIMIVGPITGASLNPARAFGPEFVSALGGGATHWNQLIPVYILPGLVGGAAFAFVTSFDEVVIAIFLAGDTAKTLPVKMWEIVRVEFTPVAAVGSSLLIALTLLMFVAVQFLKRPNAAREAEHG